MTNDHRNPVMLAEIYRQDLQYIIKQLISIKD
jgi:hypothetical protein